MTSSLTQGGIAAPSLLSPQEMPAFTEIARGEGPTILLTGGIHGDEHEAQVVLRQLAASIDPPQVTGRLRFVPVLNHPGALAGARVADEDGQNMNRVFPGNPQGGVTERIADWLVTRMFPEADLLIDVHAGGRDLRVVPMVFGYADADSRMGPDQLDRVLKGWGYRFVQHMGLNAGTVCHAALAVGLASVEVEGGGGRMTTEALDTMRQGILNGLVACGAMRGTPVAFDGVEFDVPESAQIYASVAGVVEHLVALGDLVSEGQPVARLHFLQGATLHQDVTAPAAGIVLRQTQHAWLPKGRQIGNIGIPRSSGPSPRGNLIPAAQLA